ncbi:MAG: hypothetical protein QN229_00140 [Desulfurococcaceae archaeon TW002]
MVKILVSNATIMTFSIKEKMLINEGFVFSDAGKVVVVGSGDPPEELKYPELLLTGKERLVIPGLSSAFTNLSHYLLRYRENLRDLSSDIEYLRKITRIDMYFLAAMAFAELISRGVTTALVIDVYLDEAARAAHDLSFNVVLAPPFNCGLEEFAPEAELRLLLSRWHEKVEGIKAGIAVCSEVSEKIISLAKEYKLRIFQVGGSVSDYEGVEVVFVNPTKGSGSNVIRWGPQLSEWKPEEGLGVGVRPSYDMKDVVREVSYKTSKHPIDVLYSAIVRNPILIGFNDVGPLERNMKTNLLMLDASEPPGWPLPKNLSEITKAVVEGNLRVETVILDDEILVDSGETMTIGNDLINKAKKRLANLIRE